MAKYQRHKIKYCPVCGYVDLTEKENSCSYCNNSLSVSNEYFDEVCSRSELTDKSDIEEYVRQLYVYNDDNFSEDIMSARENAENVSEQIDYYENLIFNNVDDNDCKCPTCNSTNIEKISLGKKAFGGAMFGIFSSDVRKTMHCKSCGYKW